MVISHFTPHLNFGHFSMDFDSFIPPIPPNFTPGSPAIIPSSPQIMFPPVPGSNLNPNLFPRTQVVPQYSHKKETSPSLLAQNDSSLTPSSLSPPFDGTVGAKKESGAMLSDLSKQHPISNKSLSPGFDSENVLSTNENRESNQSSAGCDNSSPSPLSSATEKIPKCIGCCEPILDQFILRVAPDLEWHAHCLKCHQCSTVLDERQTCYLKDGKPYCKLDYIRLFSIRCGKCDLPFEKTDRVMRTMNKVYHVECFSCNVCFKQLLPGDEYAIRDDLIFCRDDMVELMTSSAAANANQSPNQNSLPTCENPSSAGDTRIAGIPSEQNSPKYGGMQNNSVGNNLSLSLSSSNDLDRDDKIIFSPDDKSCKDSAVSLSVRGEKRHHSSKDGSSKPTRIRTVLNEKQLHTLRTCYNANPRPDALMREQLVEMTGLSPRVIRVWFQNKRCKDKKRSIAIKQMHQLQAEKNISGLNGVPMVAGSPMRHDPVLDGQFPPYPHPPYGLPHHPHHASEMDPAYMMAFDNGGGGPGSVISDGCLGSPAGSDCSLSLSSD